MTPDRFLRVVFAHLPPGIIELRLIEEKKGGKVVLNPFFSGVDELLASRDHLLEAAQRHNAAIFFGVLPRREKGKGRSSDTTDGLVVWCDLDFKDFVGGEAEARERLAAFPIPPSILLGSGHGLHAYWLLREPTAAHELSKLSKGTARALGGDHAFDAARLLRLPGTYNRKDAANPILVEIEVFEEQRVYNASEIVEALELAGVTLDDDAEPGRTGPKGSPHVGRIGSQLSPRVMKLLETKRHFKALYEGRGKLEKGEDGRDLDRSRSGYDYSVAYALLRLGIEDLDEVATAVALRPDVAEHEDAYVWRTVNKAWEGYQTVHGSPSEDPAAEIDFTVEKVRIFSSDPARYEVTSDGKPMLVTSGVLASPRRFKLRFMDAHKRIPRLPDDASDWAALVNGWLASAEVVEAPPEASIDIAVYEAVEEAIVNLRVKDDARDLDKGGAIVLDDQKLFFRTNPLVRVVQESHPKATSTQICFILREQGWENGQQSVAGRKLRGWSGTRNASDARAGSSEEEK